MSMCKYNPGFVFRRRNCTENWCPNQNESGRIWLDKMLLKHTSMFCREFCMQASKHEGTSLNLINTIMVFCLSLFSTFSQVRTKANSVCTPRIRQTFSGNICKKSRNRNLWLCFISDSICNTHMFPERSGNVLHSFENIRETFCARFWEARLRFDIIASTKSLFFKFRSGEVAARHLPPPWVGPVLMGILLPITSRQQVLTECSIWLAHNI